MLDLATAKTVCERHGSTLLTYEAGVSARLVLQSGEEVLLSMGMATAKVFTPRQFLGFGLIFPKLGWSFPETVASEQLSAWEPKFFELGRMARYASRALILDGLLDVASFCPSTVELRAMWLVMKNPIEIAYSKQREDGVKRG